MSGVTLRRSRQGECDADDDVSTTSYITFVGRLRCCLRVPRSPSMYFSANCVVHLSESITRALFNFPPFRELWQFTVYFVNISRTTYSLRDRSICDEHLSESVRPSSHISRKPCLQTSPNLLCMLPAAVARSSSGGIAVSVYFWFLDCVVFNILGLMVCDRLTLRTNFDAVRMDKDVSRHA